MRNPLKERLAGGGAITIAVLTAAGPAAAQIWARSGIDCLILDMEHGAIGIESVHAMVAATAGSPATPIVRVPWNVPWLVKPVLDTGAMGICFPMIADADDAAAAVRSVRYPPDGERGWGPFAAHMRWGESMASYVEGASDELFTILLIERPEAIRNLDQIVRVPGIDMLVIAPFDLTVTMGHGSNREHPEVLAAIRTAEEKVLASAVPLGGAAFTAAAADDMLARGYRGIFLGFDWLIVQRAVGGLINGMNLGR
jgi:4-hydroxy-2-oxoheptanedioate aldolase